jgi:hypothetical protein
MALFWPLEHENRAKQYYQAHTDNKNYHRYKKLFDNLAQVQKDILKLGFLTFLKSL